MADVEHSQLPDELLHEPKGASTAAAGTVYVADGAGSGSFLKVPTTSLDMTLVSINNAFDVSNTVTVGNKLYELITALQSEGLIG